MPSATKIDEIVSELYRRILENTYKVGDQLPSERELATELKASRQTVRTALLRLQSENAIDIIPSKGVYVRQPHQKTILGPWVRIKRNFHQDVESFETSEIFVKNTTISYMEKPAIIAPPPHVAFAMDLPPTRQVMREYRLFIMDNTPYRIVDRYTDILASNARVQSNSRKYKEMFLRGETHFEILNVSDEGLTASETINCRMPQAQEADILKMSRLQAVFDVERLIFAEDGTVLSYTKTIANAALHEITFLYNKNNWSTFINNDTIGW